MITLERIILILEKRLVHACTCKCGDLCDCIDDDKTSLGAYGYLDEVRCLCNDLRDNIEDNVDEEGFVNF